MAVAATNCRRESFFRDIGILSLVSQSRCDWRSLFCFSSVAGQAEMALQDVAKTSLLTIRAELLASVEKSGDAQLQNLRSAQIAAADCR
jgi:hypothetical protein